MLQRSLSWFVISATAIVPGLGNPAPAQAADDDAAAAAKADEWLKAMTLDEKIGQMTQADLKAVKRQGRHREVRPRLDAQRRRFRPRRHLGPGLGEDARRAPVVGAQEPAEDPARSTGSTRSTATTTSTGRSSSRTTSAWERRATPGSWRRPSRITALEMAGTGIRWAFAPCVAVARDERWGRTYESFGETPELVEVMGAAAVRGLQGATPGRSPRRSSPAPSITSATAGRRGASTRGTPSATRRRFGRSTCRVTSRPSRRASGR